jgi:hypothetical protein
MIFNLEEKEKKWEMRYAYYVKGIVFICSFSTKDKAYKTRGHCTFQVHQRFNEIFNFA